MSCFRVAAAGGGMGCPAARYPGVETATGLMRRFLDPVFAGTVSGAWDPATVEWVE
jgi:hypothetical protein